MGKIKREVTIPKYLAILTDVFRSKHITKKESALFYPINYSYLDRLVDMEFMSFANDTYTWIGSAPTELTVTNLLDAINAQARQDRKRRSAKKKSLKKTKKVSDVAFIQGVGRTERKPSDIISMGTLVPVVRFSEETDPNFWVKKKEMAETLVDFDQMKELQIVTPGGQLKTIIPESNTDYDKMYDMFQLANEFVAEADRKRFVTRMMMTK